MRTKHFLFSQAIALGKIGNARMEGYCGQVTPRLSTLKGVFHLFRMKWSKLRCVPIRSAKRLNKGFFHKILEIFGTNLFLGVSCPQPARHAQRRNFGRSFCGPPALSRSSIFLSQLPHSFSGQEPRFSCKEKSSPITVRFRPRIWREIPGVSRQKSRELI